SDNSIARRHAAMTSTPLLLGSRGLCRNPKHPDESPRNDNFHGIGRLVFGHAHGRSPAWRSSAPTIAPRVSATFSRRRGLRRLLGEASLERRVHFPPLSGGGRAVPLR